MSSAIHASLHFVKSPGREAVGDTAPVAEAVAGVLADVRTRRCGGAGVFGEV